MRSRRLALAALITLIASVAWSSEVAHDVSGIWTRAGSPYYVVGDVTVPTDLTLSIEPGVQIIYTGPHVISVYGSLFINGTAENPVQFVGGMVEDSSLWGRGVRVYWPSDRLIVKHAVFRNMFAQGGNANNAGGALYIQSGFFRVSNCDFSDNIALGDAGALHAGHGWSEGTIEDCRFIRNRAYNPPIWSEPGAMLLADGFYTVCRCLFQDNYSVAYCGAFTSGRAVTQIENCTFVNNRADMSAGALHQHVSGETTMRNCILWGNTAPENSEIWVTGGSISVSYADIEDGWDGAGNIIEDPLFVNPESGDFHLQAGSPCIDAGDPNSPLDPDGTRNDMGAYPYFHIPERQHVAVIRDFGLEQNQPNPFNPVTQIRFTVPERGLVTLSVYNSLGQLVEAAVNGPLDVGTHAVDFDGSNLPSGFYFYRLNAGGLSETRRMLLIK